MRATFHLFQSPSLVQYCPITKAEATVEKDVVQDDSEPFDLFHLYSFFFQIALERFCASSQKIWKPALNLLICFMNIIYVLRILRVWGEYYVNIYIYIYVNNKQLYMIYYT